MDSNARWLRHSLSLFLSGLLVVLALMAPALAQEAGDAETTADAAPAQPLRVAIKSAPPFVIKGQGQGDAAWSGISVELWRQIAEAQGLQYAFHEVTLDEMLRQIRAGEADVAVGALTVTSEREAFLDFTHPFHTSGLGIATRVENTQWTSALANLFSWQLASALASLTLVLLIVGLLVWAFERRRNEQFGGSVVKGIGSGFWFSAVTMTTVGYGDKAPVTTGGRFIALVWMFTSIVVISAFTAAIASAITVGLLEPSVQGPDDLNNASVVSVDGTTSEQFLTRRGVAYRSTASIDEALQRLQDKRAQAVVYDAPILQYMVNNLQSDDLEVLPGTFQTQYYALALPSGSPLREPINREVLAITRDSAWRQTLNEYLGTAE